MGGGTWIIAGPKARAGFLRSRCTKSIRNAADALPYTYKLRGPRLLTRRSVIASDHRSISAVPRASKDQTPGNLNLLNLVVDLLKEPQGLGVLVTAMVVKGAAIGYKVPKWVADSAFAKSGEAAELESTKIEAAAEVSTPQPEKATLPAAAPFKVYSNEAVPDERAAAPTLTVDPPTSFPVTRTATKMEAAVVTPLGTGADPGADLGVAERAAPEPAALSTQDPPATSIAPVESITNTSSSGRKQTADEEEAARRAAAVAKDKAYREKIKMLTTPAERGGKSVVSSRAESVSLQRGMAPGIGAALALREAAASAGGGGGSRGGGGSSSGGSGDNSGFGGNEAPGNSNFFVFIALLVLLAATVGAFKKFATKRACTADIGVS